MLAEVQMPGLLIFVQLLYISQTTGQWSPALRKALFVIRKQTSL